MGAVTFTQRAFVKVLIAGWSNVSCRAGTEVVSANRVGVTVGAFLTRITDAGIIQLAQQPWKTIKTIMSLQNAGCNFVQLMTGNFTRESLCTGVEGSPANSKRF